MDQLSSPVVIVPTTPLYFWELAVFLRSLESFWPEVMPVILCAERPKNLEGLKWSFQECSCSNSGRYPVGLSDWLGTQSFETFVLLHSDFWLDKPVNQAQLDEIQKFMLSNRDVVRISLDEQGCHDPAPGGPERLVYEGEYVNLYGCQSGRSDCFFSFALIPAIWSRELFIKVAQSGAGWDPWELEKMGKYRLTHDFPSFKSYVSRPQTISYQHLARTRERKVDLRSASPYLAGLCKTYTPDGFQVLE